MPITGPVKPRAYFGSPSPGPAPLPVEVATNEIVTCPKTGRMWIKSDVLTQMLPYARTDDGTVATRMFNDTGKLKFEVVAGGGQVNICDKIRADLLNLWFNPGNNFFGAWSVAKDNTVFVRPTASTIGLNSDYTFSTTNQALVFEHIPNFYSQALVKYRYQFAVQLYHNNGYEANIGIIFFQGAAITSIVREVTVSTQSGGWTNAFISVEQEFGAANQKLQLYVKPSATGVVIKSLPPSSVQLAAPAGTTMYTPAGYSSGIAINSRHQTYMSYERIG